DARGGRSLTVSRGKPAIALRYALAPVCVGAAVLLSVSPAGSLFHPSGPFILAVVAAAWFGGAGARGLPAVLSPPLPPPLTRVALDGLSAARRLLRFAALHHPRVGRCGVGLGDGLVPACRGGAAREGAPPIRGARRTGDRGHRTHRSSRRFRGGAARARGALQ